MTSGTDSSGTRPQAWKIEAALRSFLRPEASVKNPVDLIGTIDAGEFRQCLELLMDSREVDAVITIYVPREPGTSPNVARAVHEGTAARGAGKTSLAVFMQTDGVPAELVDATSRVPGYQYPEAAAGALALAIRYAEHRARPLGRIPEFPEIRIDACRAIVDQARTWAGPEGSWLGTADVQNLLETLGLPVPRWKVATSADEAVVVAGNWKTPVVLKVNAPTVLHKTDVGGVVVNVAGDEAVRTAYQQVTLSVPEAKGAFVQEFIPGGCETFIGVSRDRQFGHLVAFGCGGTAVELLDDVACRLHPLTDIDAEEMIHGVRTAPLLTGYRGQPAADTAALKDALSKFSVPDVECRSLTAASESMVPATESSACGSICR